jgi:lipid-A-disaccharide synthase-like uncharacterized protein
MSAESIFLSFVTRYFKSQNASSSTETPTTLLYLSLLLSSLLLLYYTSAVHSFPAISDTTILCNYAYNAPDKSYTQLAYL